MAPLKVKNEEEPETAQENQCTPAPAVIELARGQTGLGASEFGSTAVYIQLLVDIS